MSGIRSNNSRSTRRGAAITPGPSLESISYEKLPASLRKLVSKERDTDWQLDNIMHKRQKVSVADRFQTPKRAKDIENDSAVIEPSASKGPSKKTPPLATVPGPFRSLVENESLASLIQQVTICRKCRIVDTLEVTFPSVSLATTPTIRCRNCGVLGMSPLSMTSLERGKRGNIKISDYAVNVLYVLGFLTLGDGGTEAQKVMGMLGLPNIQSMEKSTFPKVERSISPSLETVVQSALKENLLAEVQATMKDDPDFDFNKWRTAIENGGPFTDIEMASLIVSMDMGWQKKGSGRTHNSNSGHACLVGMITRKPIKLVVKIKLCQTCRAVEEDENKTEDDIPDHDCLRNHIGSSGSMEAGGLLDMLHDLHDTWHCCIDSIVTDDDSKMKAQAKWNNANYERHCGQPPPRVSAGKDGKTKPRPDHGELNYPAPESKFLADPAHRKKTLRNKLCKVLGRKKKERCGFSPADIIRLCTNFAHMSRQLPSLMECEWVDAAKAVLEHHFDNHEYCGDFCKRAQEILDNVNNGKFYRNKEEDKELYNILVEVIAPFITMDRLAEIGHGHDTNVNEALNNIISWFAPKNKTYCLSRSLINRVNCAVSINSIGFDSFYKQVFDCLGVDVPQPTVYYIEQRERWRQTRIRKSKTFEHKKKRSQKMHKKLREHTKDVQDDITAGKGYKTGVAMDMTQDEKGTPHIVSLDSMKVCKSCGRVGHKRSNQSSCPNNKKKLQAVQLQKEAEEQSMFDQVEVGEDMSEDTLELVDALVTLEAEDDENYDLECSDLISEDDEDCDDDINCA